MYRRPVPLPSGGSLVIDSTEAIVAIDVNSGKFRDHADAETTAFKTDMEAADEIPRQLRLRDLGGVIICDFIDLRYERHRRDLEKRLHDNLRDDRARTKMLRMSQFGIIEMTRQRMRPSLKRSIYFDCPHCKGAGLVKTPERMALAVMRRLAIAANDQRISRLELVVCPEVGFYLQNKKRAPLAALEQHWGKRIMIKTDPNLGMDAMKLELYDARDGLVFLEELGMIPAAPAPAPAARPPQRQQQGGRGDRREQQRDHRDQRGRGGRHDQQRRDQRPPQRQQQQRPQPAMAGPQEGEEREDIFDMDRAEDAVEQREVELLSESNEIAPPPAPLEESPVAEQREQPIDEPEPEQEQEQWPEEEEPIVVQQQPAPPQPAKAAQKMPQEDEQPQNRRGRGRGSRGRGRGRGNDQQQSPPPAQVPHSEAPQPPAPQAASEQRPDEQKGGGRRRKGSRGRGGRGR